MRSSKSFAAEPVRRPQVAMPLSVRFTLRTEHGVVRL